MPAKGAAQTVLSDVFGFEDFRLGQKRAVKAAMRGHDVAVLLPTGAGKSLCYQVPGIAFARQGKGPALVISPLIALMSDQVDALRGQGVKAAALNSHQNDKESREIMTQFLAGELELLYVSPERASHSGFRNLLRKRRVGLLAVDEAHCVSQWGHDFRTEYMQLSELRDYTDAPLMAVTATATATVLREITKRLELRNPVVVRGDFRRPNLTFSVENISRHKARLARLREVLEAEGLRGTDPGSGKAIVYCSTRAQTEKVSKDLISHGFAARHYHAGRTQVEREKAQTAFGIGRLKVLVATNAFGMGIDYPDVRLVVHYQTPGSLEAYYQEAGRAGRDGEPAKCIMFFGMSDLMTQQRIVSNGKTGGSFGEALRSIQNYGNAERCREQMICAHFGVEEGVDACGRCDVCTDTVRAGSMVVEKDAPKIRKLRPSEKEDIVAAVDELTWPVGKTGLAKALKGSRAKSLDKCGLLELSQHGWLRKYDVPSIVAAIEECIDEGSIVRRKGRFPTIWLPDKPLRPNEDWEKPKLRQRKPMKRTGFKRRSEKKDKPEEKKRHYSPLMGALERFRKDKAAELEVAPYMIIQRRTIVALDEDRPLDEKALERIPGLGKARIEQYGEDLLRLLRENP